MIAAERTAAIRLATARLCGELGWARVHEMRLPDGRRADIMALRPDGGFVCIEVKSGQPDFVADQKWQAYREFSDALYFAVDDAFPQQILPEDVGLIVAVDRIAVVLRAAPEHPLPAARRRSLVQRFATLAALRLAALEDPPGATALLAALRAQ